ncbi:hypothetical protein ACFL20_06450 [Spirochaetota bacterium]
MKKIISIVYVIILSIIFISCKDTIIISELPIVDVNPTAIELDENYTVTIEAWGTMFYSFTTEGAGTYTISLFDLATDFGWTLCPYDNTGKVDVTTCFPEVDDFDNNTSEIDSINLDMESDYLIAIDEYSNEASEFTLRIDPPSIK